MTNCRIIVDEQDKVSVLTQNSEPSALFNKIKALPDVSNENEALQLWAKVQTPTFKNWFGLDWETISQEERESLINEGYLDYNGEPNLFYRGDFKGTEEFNYSDVVGKFGQGIYIAESLEQAESFAQSVDKKVYPVFVKPGKTKSFSSITKFNQAAAKALGINTVPTNEQKAQYVDQLHNEGFTIIGRGIFGREFNVPSKDRVASIFNKSISLAENSALSEEAYEAKDFFNPEVQERLNSEIFLTNLTTLLSENLGFKKENIQKITADEARILTKDAKNPYNGQPAFFFNGNIYFVSNNLNYKTLVHEFSHPLVRSLMTENPELFNQLFNELIATPEGQQFLQEALSEYPEFDQNADIVKEEVVVKALSKVANEKVQDAPIFLTNSFQDIIKKFLYHFKKLLRKVFGSKVNVSKLDTNTSLEQLADMLFSKQWGVNLDIISQDDVVAYMKDITKASEDIVEQFTDRTGRAKIYQSVIETAEIYTKLLNQLKQNEDLVSLQLMMQDEFQTSIPEEALRQASIATKDKVFKQVEEEEKNLVEFIKIANAFSTSVLGMHNLTDNITKRIDQLLNAPTFNEKNALREVNVYNKTLKHYAEFVNRFIDIANQFEIPLDSDLIKDLTSLETKVNRAESKILNFQKELYRDVLFEVWENQMGNKKEALERQKKIYEDILKGLAPENTLRRKSVNLKLKDINTALSKVSINKEDMLDYMMGQRGDLNYLSAWMENYTAQQDPSISSFAMYVKQQLSDAQTKAYTRFNMLRDKLESLEKELGLSPADIEKYADAFLSEDITKIEDENGDLVDFPVYTILNPYKNLDNTKVELYSAVTKAKEAYEEEPNEDTEKELNIAQKNYSDHVNLFYNKKFVDEYYYLEDIIRDNPKINGEKLLQKLNDIYTDIDVYQKKAESEFDTTINFDIVKEKKKELKQLYSLYDGPNKKTGAQLEEALALREFRDAKKKFTKMNLIEGSFERALMGQEVKIKVMLKSEGLSPEDFETRFQEERAAWIKANTRKTFTDDFYEDKKKITDKIQELVIEFEQQLQADKTLKDVADAKVLYKGQIYDVTYSDDVYTLTRDKNKFTFTLPGETLLSELDMALPTQKAFDVQRQMIFESLLGQKDENGEYMATEMTPEHLAMIKKLQEEIEKEKDELIGITGITGKDQKILNTLFEKRAEGFDLAPDEQKVLSEILQKKGNNKLPKAKKVKLMAYYATLNTIQKKEASSYYLDEINETFEGVFGREITIENADDILNPIIVDQAFQKSEEFKKWFLDNHILVEYYDYEFKSIQKTYKRLAAWERNVPNLDKYYNKFDMVNSKGEKEPIDGEPSYQFYRTKVKDIYHTGYNSATGKIELIEGIHTDTKGKLAPKNLEQLNEMRAKYPEKFQEAPYAWDHYVDYKYYKIQEEGGPKKEILNSLLEFLLETQKGLDQSAKLGYQLPRLRKDFYESVSDKDSKDLKEKGQQLWNRFAENFRSTRDDYESELNFVETVDVIDKFFYKDLDTKVPIRGKYQIEKNQVSKDIFAALGVYALSSEENQVLKKSNPMARVMQDLAKNDPATLKKQQKGAFGQKVLSVVPGSENLRQKVIDSIVEINYEGKNMKSSSAIPLFKPLQSLGGLASFSFFAFDVHSAAKNYIGARSMIGLEAISSKYFNYGSWLRGQGWATQAMFKLSNNIYNKGTMPLEVQMLDLFDAFQGRFSEKFAKSTGRSFLRDFVNMSWVTNTRQYLEISTNVEAFSAIMHHTKLKRILPDGSSETIRYIDAWEIDPNTKTIKLKSGIDGTYDLNGDKFNEIKFASQEINNFAQGLYAPFDRAMITRLATGKAVTSMKNYFTKMFINRFGYGGSIGDPQERLNLATGNTHLGFYIRGVQSARRVIRTGGAHLMYMDSKEKQAFAQMMLDLLKGTLIWRTIIMGWMLGFDLGDDDKYDEMSERSGALPTMFTEEESAENWQFWGWVQNNLILLAVNAESEISHFNPLNPREMYAVPFANSWVTTEKTMGDLISLYEGVGGLLSGDEKIKYQKTVGNLKQQQAGEYKFLMILSQMIGLKGKLIDPETTTRRIVTLRRISYKKKDDTETEEED
jgi:hypothetical protein